MKFDELEAVYRHWLHLDHDPHLIKLVYALLLANRYDGNPVWMNLIGPAGSGKTQILTSLSTYDGVVPVSTLTPASLMSGYSQSASLLYELDRKCLVVEDMSAILELPKEQKSQMFSFLRSAYNGEFTRATGKGKETWNGKFGMLCGATLAIEHHKNSESLLGERFLNVRMRIDDATEIEMMRRARGFSLNKTRMNETLQQSAAAFLSGFVLDMTDRKLSGLVVNLIERVSLALSRLRSGVVRDAYHRDEILFPVEASEIGTRLMSQFQLVALAAKALGMDAPAQAEILYRLFLDSTPYIRLRILQAIHSGATKRVAICARIRMSENPTERHLQEMQELGLVNKKKGGHFFITHDVLTEALEAIG